MERKQVWVGASGLVVMVLTVWLLYPNQRRHQVSLEKARFMYCPDCGKEWFFERRRFEGGCPRCGTGHEMIPTQESIVKGNAAAPPGILGRLLAPLLVEANLLLFAILYLNHRKRAQPKEPDQLRMRCHQCHQKIRYPVNKIGWQGRCPRCKTIVTFTSDPDDEEEEDEEEED